MKNIVYTFMSPFSTQQTAEMICRAMEKLGTVKEANHRNGHIKAIYKLSTFQKYKYNFYIEHSEKACRVRMVMADDGCLDIKRVWRIRDGAWDKFLTNLFELSPDTDFGVTLSDGSPYVMGVLYLENDIEQVYISHTKRNTSITGFLLGGALFGDAGAIVGGMSGRQRTIGHTYTQFANSQLSRIIYNNGRLWEGVVTKGSELYNEIMVNMQ